MHKRAGILVMLIFSVLTISESRHFCATALGRSAHAFCLYFRALSAERLNPLEQIVLSVVLANTEDAHR
jgi:hypothetical protein